MQLTYHHQRRRFECISTFAEKDIPKGAGFFWDGSEGIKRWQTLHLPTARKLEEYADDSAKEAFVRLEQEQVRSRVQASWATDADLDIPVPAGLSYLGYQKAGIAFAAARSATLIGDDPGLGKTIQAVGVINYHEHIKNVLIVAPAPLLINWQRELEKWLVRPLTIGRVRKQKYPDTDIVIVSYESLKRHKAAILEREQWDLIIGDEGHRIKNPKAERSKIFKEVSLRFGKRILLSGTPVLNRPIELWHLLHVLSPEKWNEKSYWSFAKRYCGPVNNGFGTTFNGASNTEELQRILRQRVMVRRLKAEVLPELPQKRRQIIELPEEDFASALSYEAALFSNQRELAIRWKSLKNARQSGISHADFANAVHQLRADQQTSIAEMSRARHATALAKVPAVVEHCKEMLETTGKIVVFAHHLDVIAALKEGLKEFNPVTLTGADSGDQKQAAVDTFQLDPNCRVFIGGIRPAGEGWTLTAASLVLFCELCFTPSAVTQAEDRCYRLGQLDSVLCQHIVVNGSIDAHLAKMLLEKQAVIDQVLDVPAPEDEDELTLEDIEALFSEAA